MMPAGMDLNAVLGGNSLHHVSPREKPSDTAARGYLRASACGSSTPCTPSARSWRNVACTRSTCSRSSGASRSGNGTRRSLPPLPWRTVTCRYSKSNSCTRNRSASINRSPEPYIRLATSRGVPPSCDSTERTSRRVITTGTWRERRAMCRW